MRFLHWERLEPVLGGKGRRAFFPAGQSSRGVSALALTILISCMLLARMDRHTRDAHGPHHNHHTRLNQAAQFPLVNCL